MSNYLVIVESPAKAKTIKKYLGSKYNVIASMGHLRDLPKSNFGIDIENNFEPKYIPIRGKGDLIKELKKGAKAADKVFLATDPDREGEAISWHLSYLLGIDEKEACRIAFNEITKTAVQNAVKNPRMIDMKLVDAQQARRVLDRIVGYKLSPLLWKKVKRGLSAGRVQSVATRIIADREDEINAFVTEEYWSLDVKLTNDKGKSPFVARIHKRLIQSAGAEGEKLVLPNEQAVNEIKGIIKDGKYMVRSLKVTEKHRNPSPPFTTSTMQQEASRKLGFMSRRTMSAAQQLYEGVNIKGTGHVGLITYIRTDSVRIESNAQREALSFIESKYGKEYIPDKPRFYKGKKNAQDAHEAIRPTSMKFAPDEIKDSLTADQYKLYRLIWNRFVASQMASALIEATTADITEGNYIFRATGNVTKFKGFTAVYTEGKDTPDDEGGKLPSLTEGQSLLLADIFTEQHFTQPPPRYTEASLIKAMEENGIGRPSTYAPTISTITSRGYVARDGKNLFPTELGCIVTKLMKENFENIVDIEFTAQFEEKLDKVEDGEGNWKELMGEFYVPFEKTLEIAEEKIGKVAVSDEVSEVPCEKCGRMMVYKQGRFGKFLACPGYPECMSTKAITNKVPDVECPKCGNEIHMKTSKKGIKYYGCEKNPTCDFMSWDEPTSEKCPSCNGMLMKRRPFKGKGPFIMVCCNTECGYKSEPRKATKATKGTSRSDVE